MNDQIVPADNIEDYITRLERMIYDCVSLRDVMTVEEYQKIYNQIVQKFQGEDNDEDYGL